MQIFVDRRLVTSWAGRRSRHVDCRVKCWLRIKLCFMLLLFILYVSCNEGDCQAAKPSPGSLEFYSLEYEEWPMQDFYKKSSRADYRHFASLSGHDVTIP